MTVVLEYLDRKLIARSWVSLLAFTQIHLCFCKGFLWWLLQLQTDFQFTVTTSTTDWFSVHCSEWLWHNWVEFIHKFDSIIWHLLGFVFYFHGLSPISFKPQKGTPTMFTPSICQISTNFFQLVYPVGVTHLRPFYVKINHNSVYLYQIPTKIGTGICFNVNPLCVTSFSLIGVCFYILWPKC